MVNSFVYCPRLFYLEWVQGEFVHSVDTLEGAVVHRRVDDEAGPLPEPEQLEPGDRIAARGVTMSAPALGLVARIDLLEGNGNAVRPVDYKKGGPGKHGPWEPDRVQLCVQGLILRENGYVCAEGVVYYAATRQRFVVSFDDELVGRTLEVLDDLRRAAADPQPPPPLVDSPKCPRCSLVGICLPDEVNLLRGAPAGEVRRLVPARDESGPLYVVTQGATVGKTGERLVVRAPDTEPQEVRLIDVSELSAFGNVQVTAGAIRALVDRGIPILHLTYGGWLVAVTSGPAQRNVQMRLAQYQVATNDSRSLRIARALVSGKIRNQRTLLRRNHRSRPVEVLAQLNRLADQAERARTADQLLGIEGNASRLYFASFAGLLKDDAQFDFTARTRRPPTDPVNALLSFLYSLLMKDCLRAVLAAALDPYVGFFHRLHYGRPSLALDLAEEFRPIIGDSVVVTALNTGVVKPDDFIRRGPACALKDPARRRVLDAYEARMETLVRHPVFGYSVSYRRVLEVQARLLARVVLGELKAYVPFTTR
ncbi:MAG TPA: CRISPR-associated endonuclease Cas1 [bacterium]|nr:CRISPR-associated endonuclease Cas1 [bacterium]